MEGLGQRTSRDAGPVRHRSLFLYRPAGAPVCRSSVAFVVEGKGFERNEGKWRFLESGVTFDTDLMRFTPTTAGIEPLHGFDTFWFNWSMNNPGTEILDGE